MTGPGPDGHDDRPPFQRHAAYYVALKLMVLAAALALAAKWIGLW